ncbi:MAG: ATP-binding protein [Thermomicrobiales bacterium]
MSSPSSTDRRPDEPIPLAPLPAWPRSLPPRLPAPLTPLVGREREVVVIAALVRDPAVRLVTLTGPGGVGKTRLALQVATELADAFADGVAFVDLAAVRDPALVASTIAQTLGVRPAGADALQIAVRNQELLLLLDNFEQVIEAGPRVTELLQACPRLTALVTSRSLLRVAGERAAPVSPLALPAEFDGGALPPIAELEEVAAVRLLVERTRAVHPSFALSETNAPAVATVVRRLDGLPLAIELAAARGALFSPEALLGRLTERLPLLTGGPRDLPARLQTMRAAIAWSYDLLPPEEQHVFRCLAAFAGGCALEAAEAVCGGQESGIGSQGERFASSPTPNVVDAVESLTRQSLVQVVAPPDAAASAGTPRLTMLETVREFAAEALAAGEQAALQRAHAAYYLALAERHDLAEMRPDGERLLALLELERANFRAALAWLESAGEAELFVRLAAALGSFWAGQGHYQEGQRCLERALALGDAVPNGAKAGALVRLGMIRIYQGANDDAARRLQEGLALSRDLDEPFRTAQALTALGVLAIEQGDDSRATTYFTEALAASEAVTDRWLAGIVAGRAYANLGVVARMRGDLTRAAAHHEEALRRERASGYLRGVTASLGDLGDVARDQGDYGRALAWYQEALGVLQDGNLQTRSVNEVLEGVATVAAATGQPERAARLLGAVAGLRERIGLGLRFPADILAYQRAVAAARVALGEEAFAAAWSAGRDLPRDQVVAEALAVDAPPEQPLPIGAPTLTKREMDVLRLLVAGQTDREIADALYIGRRTAEWHVARILEKLGVRTRTDAVAAAIMAGLIDAPPAPHEQH